MIRNPLRDQDGEPVSREEAKWNLEDDGWVQIPSGRLWVNSHGGIDSEPHTLREAWAALVAWCEVAPVGSK